MPFNLESFSAPRTRVVHVHHHHYPDSVDESSEDDYMEDEYIGDEHEEDDYEDDEYTEDKYEEDEYTEDYLFTTSYDEESSYSGYDDSSS